ncbi:glycosyltransferase [Oerskovia sp. M15]
MMPAGPEREVPGLEPGFLLCVARLLPYKNVDVLIEAARLADRQLVIVGDGPDRVRLEGLAARGGQPPDGGARRRARGRREGSRLLGRVDDPELRWLYRHCAMLVAASYEDFGLSRSRRAPSVARRSCSGTAAISTRSSTVSPEPSLTRPSRSSSREQSRKPRTSRGMMTL